MKIYNGWVVKAVDFNTEYRIEGRRTIRGKTSLIVRNLANESVHSMSRECFIENYNKGKLQYVRSEVIS